MNATQLLEPEDLLRVPGGDSYEFVHGAPKEKNMGAQSDGLASLISHLLITQVRAHDLGRVFGALTGYRCFPHDVKLVRKPDASFVSKSRLPDGVVPKGEFRISPDLAVEVISPNDLYEEVEERLTDFHLAGIRLIWIISPESKTVQIRRADGSCAMLRGEDELSGEDVIPGFTCKIAELFL